MASRAAFRSFPTAPIARGPGIYASELDTAFDDIAPYLPPTIRAAFATQTGTHGTKASGALAAHMGQGESGDENLAVMPTKNLYEIAMLVTGRWGDTTLPAATVRATPPEWSPSSAAKPWEPRKKVKIFGSSDLVNRSGSYMGFWERMDILSGRLKDLAKIAKSGYSQKSEAILASLPAKREKLEGLKAKLSGSRGADAKKALSDIEKAQKKIDKVLALRGRKRRGESLDTGGWLSVVEELQRAVDFVRNQRSLPAHARSVFDRETDLSLGMKIAVLAENGNSKLPFVAYSELPMATCPGAGTCGVYHKDKITGATASGWCYSFKAWRYPSSFRRQFLVTLANAADREFCILRHNGDDDRDGPELYWARVQAAMREQGARPWQCWVGEMIHRQIAEIIRNDLGKGRSPNLENGGRTVFFRLFVDGDIGAPDSIRSWMDMIHDLADPGLRATVARNYDIDPRVMAVPQTYGYSKCWGEFVALDRMGYRWPENYTLNLSNGSRYIGEKGATEENREIIHAVQELPFARGGFNAIDFKQHLQSLKEIHPEDVVVSGEPPMPHVTQAQLRGIVSVEGIRAGEDMYAEGARILREHFGVQELDKKGRDVTEQMLRRGVPGGDVKNRLYLEEIERRTRKKVLDRGLQKMLEDRGLAQHVKRDMARDDGYLTVQEMLADLKRKAKMAAERKGKKVEPKRAPFESDKAVQRKLVALLVHAIFQSAQRSGSGSCPLVCGNCADLSVPEDHPVYSSPERFRDFQAETGAVHRCASRVPTAGYVPPEGKRLPAGVSVDPKTGEARAYRKVGGQVQLVVGYYGSEVHIGLH